MTETSQHAGPTLPIRRTCPFTVPDDYATLRKERPVARVALTDGSDAWLLTRNEDVRTALTHPDISSDRRRPGFPLPVFGARREQLSGFPRLMDGMDGAEHAAARRLVRGEFTVRRAEALRPRIQQLVDEVLDAMLAAGPPADLVGALALPVPSLVVCELLGVPYADHDFFQTRTSTLASRSAGPDERLAAVGELVTYLAELVTAKQAEPGDDLLGRQIIQRRADGGDDRDALVQLAFLLLLAGHETTANVISLGTLTLLHEPDRLAELRDDPARIPRAVEEMLRYLSIVESAAARVAVADVEIGGQPIGAGEGVIALGLAANRDPDVFQDPDRLDFDRDTRRHVAFGYGAHQCLGQHLARVELQVVFDRLLRRVPTLRLDTDPSAVPYKRDAPIFGCYELPVAW